MCRGKGQREERDRRKHMVGSSLPWTILSLSVSVAVARCGAMCSVVSDGTARSLELHSYLPRACDLVLLNLRCPENPLRLLTKIPATPGGPGREPVAHCSPAANAEVQAYDRLTSAYNKLPD